MLCLIINFLWYVGKNFKSHGYREVTEIKYDEGDAKKYNIIVDASGGHGGTYGGGGGGGIVFVGGRTEKTKMKYEDEKDDCPGRFETTQKKGKCWLKCWTNNVILSPGQCKEYTSLKKKNFFSAARTDVVGFY
jgi:hypothetical protein